MRQLIAIVCSLVVVLLLAGWTAKDVSHVIGPPAIPGDFAIPPNASLADSSAGNVEEDTDNQLLNEVVASSVLLKDRYSASGETLDWRSRTRQSGHAQSLAIDSLGNLQLGLAFANQPQMPLAADGEWNQLASNHRKMLAAEAAIAELQTQLPRSRERLAKAIEEYARLAEYDPLFYQQVQKQVHAEL